MDWEEEAACSRGVDPEMFFPEKSSRVAAAEAKKVCSRCKVRQQCDEVSEPYGVWGGLSQSERKRERLSRARLSGADPQG